MPKRQTYIKDIRLAGYKSIKNISCDFDEGLNIIIGNNGSGKSNLLEFIDKILTRKYVGLNLFHADLNIEIGDNSYITGDMSPYANGIFHWNATGIISKEKRDLENIGTVVKEPESRIGFYTEFIRWLRTIFSDLDAETVDKAANLNNASLFEMLTNSDGTKRLIYTVFVINGFDIYPGGTKFFPITFIEEPELGIHPHQLHLFLNFLKEKAEEQQIIITTHSPQVLDILEPDKLNKITIAEISYENGTVLRHLNNAEIQKAQAYFRDQGLLSDYWRFSDFQRSKNVK